MRNKLPPAFPVICYCIILLTTNILVQWQINVWKFTYTVGLFVYPISFLFTNYVNEIYGKKKTQAMVVFGLAFTFAPSLFLSSVQITIANLLSYIVAQLYDVSAYTWLRQKTSGRLMWLRSNASSMVSLLIDTLVFTSVAFIGVLDTKTIISIMVSEYPVKVAYSIINTFPLYYMVRKTKTTPGFEGDTL